MRRDPSATRIVVAVRTRIRLRWTTFSLAVPALAAIGRGAFAQGAGATGTITGRVSEVATSTPLASASIRVVGTQIGGLTGPDGRYTIRGVKSGAVGAGSRIRIRGRSSRSLSNGGWSANLGAALKPCSQPDWLPTPEPRR